MHEMVARPNRMQVPLLDTRHTAVEIFSTVVHLAVCRQMLTAASIKHTGM